MHRHVHENKVYTNERVSVQLLSTVEKEPENFTNHPCPSSFSGSLDMTSVAREISLVRERLKTGRLLRMTLKHTIFWEAVIFKEKKKRETEKTQSPCCSWLHNAVFHVSIVLVCVE